MIHVAPSRSATTFAEKTDQLLPLGCGNSATETSDGSTAHQSRSVFSAKVVALREGATWIIVDVGGPTARASVPVVVKAC